MATFQEMSCKKCKYYESFHRYPNPNAVATHYCKKCNEEIRYVRSSPFSDFYTIWLPKRCYFNNYFEESEEYKKWLEERYTVPEYGLSCQVED